VKKIEFPTEKAAMFSDMLKTVVSNSPEGGYSLEEFRMGFKILEKIDVAEASIDFEDSEYQFVVNRLQRQRFNVVSNDVHAFIENVLGGQ
jgi:hypothetical protein